MRLLTLSLTLVVAAPVAAQPRIAPLPRAVPSRGERMMEAYFRDQVKQIADACLTDLTTRADWERRRPELHRQFLDMMGLWPLPPRTDLKPEVTGTLEGDGFIVEKVVFQSRPGLHVTGNLYRPKAEGKHPAVLYVCGHGNVVEKGVSYGSKTFYQYHPIWFAKNGYVCLILDTLELGEIPGEHHGTHRRGWWWWHARGYTPAGVELWNAMRAIDYLESRPEVDAKRIGLTGRSGGGATSWWVAAADERVKAVVPVAGIADLYAHLCEGAVPRFRTGVISGHCDCMYMVNTHRWDFAMVVALIAPRPLLLGNSDADDIFPVAGYRRIADRVSKLYALYGADEKFQLLETKGPHRDTPELLAGINGWMNRHLKDDPSAETAATLDKPIKPEQLKVLSKLPEEAINPAIHETFVPTATIDVPHSPAVLKEWWTGRREELLTALKKTVFGGWPKSPPPLAATPRADVTHDGVRLRTIDFISETGIDLRLFVMTGARAARPKRVTLTVLDEPGWEKWCRDLGPEFRDVLGTDPKRDEAMFAQNRALLSRGAVAFAAIAPRGIGPTRWSDPGTPTDIHIRRRFPLVGQTLDGQRAWDVRRAIAALGTVPELREASLTLHGEREAAGIALFAGLFEPAVQAFDLWHLPPTTRTAPTFLNLARVLEPPVAVALVGPRPMTLHVRTTAEAKPWDVTARIATATGAGFDVKVLGD